MPLEVQHWLGHADARTTARYSHHRPQAEDAAKLARAFTTSTETETLPEETTAS